MCLTEAVLYLYGVVFLYGKNLLVRSGSDVTGTVYGRVLEEHLVIHGWAWYRNNWLLANENARPHRACVVDAYLHEQGVIHVDLAPYCPDEIGRGLEELDSQAVNLRQLGVVVQNIWQQIPLERVQTLVSSMPRRVRALLTLGGARRDTELLIHWG